jgi:Predicted membrane protein (DUF2061)
MKWLRGFEGHSRSLAKAVIWRITGSIDTFVISFIITRRLVLATSSRRQNCLQKSPYIIFTNASGPLSREVTKSDRTEAAGRPYASPWANRPAVGAAEKSIRACLSHGGGS